jgi:hypothetical protein
MGLLDYLKSWDNADQSADERKNASGADTDARPEGGDYDGGIAARWPMPENTDYGYGKDGNSGGYGHSSDCRDAGQKASAWGMSTDDIGKGYEREESGGALDSWHLNDPKAKGEHGYTQDANPKNPWNRGDDIHRNDNTSPGPHGDVGTGRDGKSRQNLG